MKKLVPVEPTAKMVEAAEDAYMPFGDMELAVRMAVLAAPAVQGEVGEGVPDYINDAIDNLAHDNYELSYAGYQERLTDIAHIRAYIARTGQPAEQQPAPDVAELQAELERERKRRFDGNEQASREHREDMKSLVEALERSVAGFDALSGMASLDAGARNYARQKALELNAVIAAHRKQGGDHDNQ